MKNTGFFLLALYCGALHSCAWGGAVSSEDRKSAQAQLEAMAKLRGDAYFRATDKVVASGKDQLKVLRSVAKDGRIPSVTRLLADILAARIERPSEFNKASFFARSLLKRAREEMKKEEADRYRAWQEEQKKRAAEVAARKRWRKEVRDKLTSAKTGTVTPVVTLDGKKLNVRKAAKDEYWVRLAKIKQPWEQWRKGLAAGIDVAMHVYSLTNFFAIFSGDTATGTGIPRHRTKGRTLPKDVSLLKGMIGRLAMLEVILAARPEAGWEGKNKDKRAQVSAADQVTILEVLASGKKVDGKLVSVFCEKLDDEAARGRGTPVEPYWRGSSDSVMGYIAHHRARAAVPHLAKFLEPTVGVLKLPRPLCAPAAKTLASVGGSEAEKALVKGSRSGVSEIRLTAIKALVHLGTKGARERLSQMMQADPSEYLRKQAGAAFKSLEKKKGKSR